MVFQQETDSIFKPIDEVDIFMPINIGISSRTIWG
jgi:hypothetical protein